MNVVLLTSDYPWHRALAHRISATPGVSLVGIVVQEGGSTRNATWVRSNIRRRPEQVASKVLQRLFYWNVITGIDRAAVSVFGEHGQSLPWPTPVGNRTPAIAHVAAINGEEAVRYVREREPDLIAVCGTRLIKEPIFALQPPRGLLNLHSGISPYYKGGPNCTLWCLANGEPQYIGSTIHVLDPGIDSGPILATAQAQIEASDDVCLLPSRAIVVGHDLYASVLSAVAEGATLPSVTQSEIGDGRTYLTREWNVFHLARAVRYVKSGELARWIASGRPGAERVRLIGAEVMG